MYRIAQFIDSTAGAYLLASAVVLLAGVGAICAAWPDYVIAAVGL